MANPRPWPFDDDDRHSGSVKPLSQADQLLVGTDAGRPDGGGPGAGATVGPPGGSAQARWRRLRAAEWATWTRTLPWRVAAILGIGISRGVLGRLLVPQLGLVVGALGAMAAGWGLRQGWAVLHDLAIPGSQANLDHVVIGPGGVFVIDSKQYRGRLQLDPSGGLWHGRYPLTPALRAVEFEADQAARVLADPQVVVLPIVAVHGAQVPGVRPSSTGCRL